MQLVLAIDTFTTIKQCSNLAQIPLRDDPLWCDYVVKLSLIILKPNQISYLYTWYVYWSLLNTILNNIQA